jgi:hypothetical protein
MSSTADQLSREEHARILREQVLPASNFDSLTSHERPKAIILAGQPGAGKGGLGRTAEAELLHDVASIDPDALRRYHPRTPDFRSQNPVVWSGRTHPDASAWADETFDVASSSKKNLILDKTLANGERAVELIKDLQQKGYEVEVRVIATHKLESELGVDRRFTDSIDQLGYGRHVPQSARDAIYDSIPRSLDMLQSNTDVPILIYNREGEKLYDSRVDPRPAGQALQEERTNRLRDPSVTQSLRSAASEQVDWHEKVPERTNDIPGMDRASHAQLVREQASEGLLEKARVQAQVGASLDSVIRPGAPPAVVVHEPEAPDLKRFGLGVGATVLGAAASAYDAHETAERVGSLLKEQNLPAAQSELGHFAARGVGGWAGGTLAAGLVGTTGAAPMAFVAADAYLFSTAFEKAVTLRENHSIYNQQDKAGVDWNYNGHAWVREASLDRTQDVVDNPIKQDVSATYEKTRELNALASARAVSLELGKLPPPQDPFNVPARAGDQRGLDNTNWQRDEQTEQWVRQVKTGVSGANDRGTYSQEVASPERARELDQEAVARVRANITNGPEAVAAAYLDTHAAHRSKDYVAVPPAVEFTTAKADTARASDNLVYRRDEAGQWTHEGVAAQGNRALELELTREIRQPSLEQFNASLEATLARPAPTPAEVDRSEMLHRYQSYNVHLPEDYLPAIELATQRTREAHGVTGRTIQELQPVEGDVYSAESAIVHYEVGADGVAHRVALTTAQDIQQAHRDLQAQRLDQAPVHEAPELRIDALSPQEREAHQQALHEANRQGASAVEAEQVATLAAMEAGGVRVDEARVPQLPEEVLHQPVPPQTGSAATPQMAAATVAVVPVVTEREEQPKSAQPSETPRQAAQEEASRAEAARVREDAERSAERTEQGRQEYGAARGQAPLVAPSPQAASAPVQATPVVPPTSDAAEPAMDTAQLHVQAANPRQPEEVPLRHEAVEPAREPVVHSVAAHSEHEQAAVSNLQTGETQDPRRGEPHSEPLSAHSTEQPPSASQSETHGQHVAEGSPLQSEQSAAQPVTTARADAEPWTPVNPRHPDHSLYQQIREEVTALDASHGRSYDQTSERLTGSLLVLAKSNGLDRVDHVVLSNPTAGQAGGHNVFVVQGEMNDPGHLRAGMPTDQAVKASFEQSMAQFDVAAQAQEQAQHLTRQRETEERQQEVHRSSMTMG